MKLLEDREPINRSHLIELLNSLQFRLTSYPVVVEGLLFDADRRWILREQVLPLARPFDLFDHLAIEAIDDTPFRALVTHALAGQWGVAPEILGCLGVRLDALPPHQPEAISKRFEIAVSYLGMLPCGAIAPREAGLAFPRFPLAEVPLSALHTRTRSAFYALRMAWPKLQSWFPEAANTPCC